MHGAFLSAGWRARRDARSRACDAGPAPLARPCPGSVDPRQTRRDQVRRIDARVAAQHERARGPHRSCAPDGSGHAVGACGVPPQASCAGPDCDKSRLRTQSSRSSASGLISINGRFPLSRSIRTTEKRQPRHRRGGPPGGARQGARFASADRCAVAATMTCAGRRAARTGEEPCLQPARSRHWRRSAPTTDSKALHVQDHPPRSILETTFLWEVSAPDVARSAEPGHFVMLRCTTAASAFRSPSPTSTASAARSRW